MSESSHIIDTVVLMYFLLVGRETLLGELLGRPLQVPLAVYDPEDATTMEGVTPRPDLLSEMRQAIRHYETAAAVAAETESTARAAESLTRIQRIDQLYDQGDLVTVDMSPGELRLAAEFQSQGASSYGLKASLGPGEAACVAIAFTRGWTIATDDSDALRVLDQLHGGRKYFYERVRKLLIRAADEGRETPQEANRLHGEMRTLGFWDSKQPFPQLER